MNLLKRFGGLAFLAMTLSAQSSAELTIAAIENSLQRTISDSVLAQVSPLLETYNNERGNKALAFTFTDQGGYAVGMGYKGANEFAASNTAMSQCINWLEENDQSGQCEILAIGDQLIAPGDVLRRDLADQGPAMAWQVEGATNTLYFLGTVHVLKSSLLPYPAVYEKFFAAGNSVVFETNPVLQSEPARQLALANLMRADPKEQKQLYSKQDRKILKRYAKSQGMHMYAIYSAKPVVSALQLTQLRTAAIGYGLASGVETHFAREASVQGKAIRELETSAEALAPLFDIEPLLQVKMLIDTVEGLHEVSAGIEGVVRGWLLGDPEAIYAQTIEELAAEPEFAKVATGMLDDRNVRWMNQIDKMFEEDEDIVIMVGSAHFGGEKGLLNLLRERGHTPVQYSRAGTPYVGALKINAR